MVTVDREECCVGDEREVQETWQSYWVNLLRIGDEWETLRIANNRQGAKG